MKCDNHKVRCDNQSEEACTSPDIMDFLFYAFMPRFMQMKTKLEFWIQFLFLSSYNDAGIGQGLGKPHLQVIKKS